MAHMETTVLRPTTGEFLPDYLVACINAAFSAVDDGGMLPRRKLSRIQIPLLHLEGQKKVVDFTRHLQGVATAGAQLQKQAEEAIKATLDAIYYSSSTP